MINYLKVLLVEDNLADARLLYEMTQELQGIVIDFTNAKKLSEAFETLRSEKFDAILLDLGLPDSLGLDTLLSIIPHADNSAIIILTGSSDMELGIKAIQSGAQDYLVKGEISAPILYRSLKYAVQRKMNLTELAQAKLEIEKNARMLEEMNANKDKFFSIVAHDLRSPFSSMLAYSEYLSHELENLSADEIKTFAMNINKSLKRILGLLENLLEWSTLQSGRLQYLPTSFNITSLIEEITELYQINAGGKQISLKCSSEESFQVLADKNMIKTVLRNLLSNAIKFTPENGAVTVGTKKSGEFAEVTVSDTGIGMTRSDLDKLFKIQENTNSIGTAKERGSGLGLILCREFVEKNGGEIHAESTPGQGSRFIFTVPLDRYA